MSSNMFKQNANNPTKYRMFFNYDNDKKVYVIPMLPEKIALTVNGKLTSMDIDSFGEVLHRGKRDAIQIEFESIFPPKFGSNYCSCLKKEFKSPAVWHKWMLSLSNCKNPFHFVLVGSPFKINMYADIVSYTPYEKGGDVGAIYYKIKIKEHRKPSISTYNKKKKKTTTSGKRPSNKDTLKYKVTANGGLHLRKAPNGEIIALIPNSKIVKSDGRKSGNWYHVKYGSNWGYAYQAYLVKQ